MFQHSAGSKAHVRTLLRAGSAIVLTPPACGGSDEVGGTVDGAASPATQPAADAATPSTTMSGSPEISGDATSGGGDGQSAASSGPENIVLVTIGGTNYEFDATPGTITDCSPDFFGAFFVNGASETGDSVSLLLPPPDDPNFEDPPSVRVRVNNGGADFAADPSILETANYADVIAEGDTQVDSFTIDGNSVSGRATFVDEQVIFAALGGTGDPPEPIRGQLRSDVFGDMTAG